MDVAVRLKGVVAGYLGMLEVTSQLSDLATRRVRLNAFYADVDLDIMLSGQCLKFGERWDSYQRLGYGERHGGNANGQKLPIKVIILSWSPARPTRFERRQT